MRNFTLKFNSLFDLQAAFPTEKSCIRSLEQIRWNGLLFGTYGGWITFISGYAPKHSTSLSGELLETKKEIRRLDEGNIEAGKRFITNLVRNCGIRSALNQIYNLWEFTSPEWNWIEKIAYDYQKQLDKED